MNFNTFVAMKKYKGKNIRVSDEVHTSLTAYLPKKFSITGWTEEAINEKIQRERLLDIPTNQRQKKEKL